MYSISNFRKHVYNRDERGWNYRTYSDQPTRRQRSEGRGATGGTSLFAMCGITRQFTFHIPHYEFHTVYDIPNIAT